jgi:hypothetical protein
MINQKPKHKLAFNRLSATDFEEFCCDLLEELGFVNLEWRKGTGKKASPADSGRDIEALFSASTWTRLNIKRSGLGSTLRCCTSSAGSNLMDIVWQAEDSLREKKLESDLKDLLKTLVAFANSVAPGDTAKIFIRGEKRRHSSRCDECRQHPEAGKEGGGRDLPRNLLPHRGLRTRRKTVCSSGH